MTTDKKITKTEYFTMLKDVVTNANPENADILNEFLDAQIEQLANKAAKAKAKAAEKRANGDELRDAIYAVLTNEFMSIDNIMQAGNGFGDDVTKPKVTARLSALVRDGQVEKESQKADGKKFMAYRKVN